LNIANWLTMKPLQFFDLVNGLIVRRLSWVLIRPRMSPQWNWDYTDLHRFFLFENSKLTMQLNPINFPKV
jgi:hypothetical protein